MSSTMWTGPIPHALRPAATPKRRPTTFLIAGLTATLIALAGCASSTNEAPPTPESRPTATDVAEETPTPTEDPTPEPTEDPEPEEEESLAGDGSPQVAYLTIPDIGIEGLRVEPYQGETDDGPGTEIQDRGLAASPHGPSGGIGPGGIGNYQVTAHRNSAGAPFFAVPDLRNGARVEVATDDRVFVYEVVDTRETSFRSEQSLAEQRAAVPGYPGRTPEEAMITISTCATQEDHAEGNYWSDEHGNPEHRIDKIGILIDSRPA
ncbi:sortase [Streptomyces sp. DSM 44917]|uniref:Sortase n=1 Tax=Streptomyces boetiae TaxID=3075541 RepID=A0ABU2LGD3_9ACTN|nr:sortase [Streptomyces sp. DSM 44917]MDT0310644.1 sortase [Streptomyces sp. DSM 44917]